MPKPRKKRKPAPSRPTAPSNRSQQYPRWIRYSAAVIIFLLLLSALVGALANVPAEAATSEPTSSATFSPLPSCAPIDTDIDGTPNNTDPDIDGDGVVNGNDDDIDGDGILNAGDGDPAATNCEASTQVPINISTYSELAENPSPLVRFTAIVAAVSAGVGYIFLRRRRGKKARSGKVD